MIWKGQKGKGRYGLEFLFINRVEKKENICGLGCVPNEVVNEIRNEKLNPRELLNGKWLERQDSNRCFEITHGIK